MKQTFKIALMKNKLFTTMWNDKGPGKNEMNHF